MEPKMKFFVYREGEHFTLPSDLPPSHARPILIPLLENPSAPNDGNPDVDFVETPQDADYIVYPYYLDQLWYPLRGMFVRFFVEQLPYFHEYEHKHVFFHCHDRNQPLLTNALILTNAPRKSNTHDRFLKTLPYAPSQHVMESAPDFRFDRMRYDTNFVGTISDNVRTQMAASINAEKRLTHFLRYPNTDKWNCEKTSYLHMKDQKEKDVLQQVFVNNMKKSWTTLCPRGMGSSSVRFYETLCMGRIPVHISDEYTFPFEDEIDYSSFCISIPQGEVKIIGPMLYNWLRKKSTDEKIEMCRTARSVWEEYFQPSKFKALCLKHLRNHLEVRPSKPIHNYSFKQHELVAKATPRRCYPEGFFNNFDIDHKQTWTRCAPEIKKDTNEWGPMLVVNGITGYLAPQDVQYLFDIVQGLPANSTIAEVGSWMGLSAVTMANGLVHRRNLSSRIYCVDTWRGSSEHQDFDIIKQDKLYNMFLDNIKKSMVYHLITPLRGNSQSVSPQFHDESIDLLFIDGDHSQKGCYIDLCAWFDKVKQGGTIIGHDYYPDSGVEKAVQQFCSEQGLSYQVEKGLRIFKIFKPKAELQATG